MSNNYTREYRIFLIEYEKWLIEKNIDLEKLRKSENHNEKGIICNAFSRERKGWKITKREKEVMKEYSN